MKKLSLFLLGLIYLSATSAQDVPAGMKYQAVARNLAGELMANSEVSVKIDLLSGGLKNTAVHYTEVQTVTTNQLGLFSLVIGEGKPEAGKFDDVPWSTEEIWMAIAIKDPGS